MSPLKLPLHRPNRPGWAHASGSSERTAERGWIYQPALRSLPYVRSRARREAYLHRPRSLVWMETPDYVDQFGWHHEFRCWFVAECWCGHHLNKSPDLLQAPGRADLVCATCEGRAVGVGLPSTDELLGILAFQPRTDWAVPA